MLCKDNYNDISKTVFKRFIDFNHNKQYISGRPYYISWEKKTSGYKKDLQIKFGFPDEINYRIYRSYDDYKQYLIKNIKAIKNYKNNKNRRKRY